MSRVGLAEDVRLSSTRHCTQHSHFDNGQRPLWFCSISPTRTRTSHGKARLASALLPMALLLLGSFYFCLALYINRGGKNLGNRRS